MKKLCLVTFVRFAGMLIVLSCASNTALISQTTTTGAFHGNVTDATGAVIPGAQVVIKNLTNNQIREATTDSSGFYTITQLRPDHYSVSVSKPGFATEVQPDVELLVNQDLEADYRLSVGQVTQQVQVMATAAMVNTANSTLSQVITSEPTVDLPLNGRQFTELILLTPGAAPKEGGQQSVYQIPIGGSSVTPSMNGQQGAMNLFTLDGVSDNHFFFQEAAISPPPDAIQEFNAQYHTTDAQFGVSSGANINIVTKTGSSEIHGDAWEFIRNNALDAANFFTNYANGVKPPYHQNQFGATIGGPVVLPGYDGRKKHTYFFGYYEGFRSAQGFTEFANVPTAQELTGNFSDILTATQITANGQGVVDPLGRPMLTGQIYNPNSTRQVTAGTVDPTTGLVAKSSGLVRDPFPGNVIPTGMVTPQALAYLNAFYPAANYGPGGSHFPDFTTPRSQTVRSDQLGVGLDHTFGNNDALSGKFYYSQPNEVIPTALSLGQIDSLNHARIVSVAYTHLFSPTLMSAVHYGYSNINYFYGSVPGGNALLAATGMGNALQEQGGIPLVPEISIAPRLSSTYQYAIPQGPFRTHQLNFDVQKVHGSHTFGAGVMYMRIHGYDNGWGASIAFDQYASSGISSAGGNEGPTGDGLASMLLNLPSSVTESAGNTAADIVNSWVGGYVQDKWQASKKLSLTVGLRWDFSSPPHYKNNEFSAFNVDCPNGSYTTPQQIQEIEEACILMPVPWVVPPTAAQPYAPSWTVPNVRPTLFDPKWNGWQPRFGFAYSLRPKTVIRSGFVIFDDHNQFDKQTQGARGDWPFALQSGAGPLASNLNRGIPTYFTTALPPAISLLTGAAPVEAVADNIRLKIPYSVEYNFGVQQQITPNMVLTVNYVGSESRHLWGTYNFNTPLPSEMGPNAFPNGLPFPFLTHAIAGESNFFIGNYNSLQGSLEKRLSKGVLLLASYTYSKCMDENSGGYATAPQNNYNITDEYEPCDYNFPHIFVVSTVYQLPIGRGMRYANNIGRGLDALIGGWNITDITSAHSGSPFTVGAGEDNANTATTQRGDYVPGCQIKPAQQTVQQYYNKACFVIAPPLHVWYPGAEYAPRAGDRGL